MSGGLEKRNRRGARRRSREPRPYQPRPFATIYGALLIAGVAGAAGVYFLLLALTHGGGAALSTKLDVAKTALLVVGGSGALAGLYVAYRKQRTDEANHIRDQDKLFTERYTQAAAQLGNTAAAVRLAGVYALARIADDSARDRPTCLSVLCSYLRMAVDPDKGDPAETEVRRTAQTVLAKRLQPDHAGFWEDADVDLRGSHLIEFDLSGAVMRSINVAKAIFTGEAHFERVSVAGDAQFGDVKFEHYAGFLDTEFGGDAWFGGVAFEGYTEFSGAQFRGDALFEAARFPGYSTFRKTEFLGATDFRHAIFTKDASFFEARFDKQASFYCTKFEGDAEFAGAHMIAGAVTWPDGHSPSSQIEWTGPTPHD
ncbi:pentapeptide repeat-containing protein [Catenulispora subtropica]|uniref:Pentapeptide repeat protein n=1 Tax=Catenulispora subtropica TaxID=450798 RepID=A0ABP5CN01_9ACTN